MWISANGHEAGRVVPGDLGRGTSSALLQFIERHLSAKGPDLDPVFATQGRDHVRGPGQLERHAGRSQSDRHSRRVAIEAERVHAQEEAPRPGGVMGRQQDPVRVSEHDLPWMGAEPVPAVVPGLEGPGVGRPELEKAAMPLVESCESLEYAPLQEGSASKRTWPPSISHTRVTADQPRSTVQ